MNGIDNLINSIDEEAQLTRQRMLVDATSKAKTIVDQHTARGDAESDSIIAAARERSSLDLERAKGQMALDESKILLRAKREVLDDTFSLAKKRLCLLSEDEYAEFLTRYVLLASLTGTERVIFNASDRIKYGNTFTARFNKALADNGKNASLTLSEKHRDIDGGFILEGNSVETDCSISTIVDGVKNTLIEHITGVLFP